MRGIPGLTRHCAIASAYQGAPNYSFQSRLMVQNSHRCHIESFDPRSSLWTLSALTGWYSEPCGWPVIVPYREVEQPPSN